MSKDPFSRLATRCGKSKYCRRRGRQRDIEDLPDREGMHRTTEGGFSFSIIKRFLNSNIGKTWDEIYSIITSDKSNNNYIIKKEINFMIYKDVIINNDKVYNSKCRSGHYSEIPNNSFYLDNSILRKYIRTRYNRSKDPFTIYENQTLFEPSIISIITVDNLKFDLATTSFVITNMLDTISYAVRKYSYNWYPWTIIKGTYSDYLKVTNINSLEVVRGPFKANYD